VSRPSAGEFRAWAILLLILAVLTSLGAVANAAFGLWRDAVLNAVIAGPAWLAWSVARREGRRRSHG